MQSLKIKLYSFTYVFIFFSSIIYAVDSQTAIPQAQAPSTQQVSPNLTALETLVNDEAAYFKKRDAWIAENAKINFSSSIVLNAEEQKLNKYLKSIIDKFGNQFVESNFFWPAQNFATVRTDIEKSPLFALLRRMPKGGLLHIHGPTEGDSEWMVHWAITHDECYIYMKDDGPTLKGTMMAFPKDQVPPGYVSMGEAAANDSNFEAKVLDMITITAEDSRSANPFAKFDKCFERCRGILHYVPFFKDYVTHTANTWLDDNIQFVEIRVQVSKGYYDLSGEPVNHDDVLGFATAVNKEIAKTHPGWTVKTILSDKRAAELTQDLALLETAFKARATYPDLIVGYDLVGYESAGHTTLYFLKNLLTAAKELSKKYNVDMPYFFHDGESDWANDDNLYDAILLNSKRIGHGFNLYYFPWLIEQVKKQDICIEVCPISNQMLGYVGDLRLHPAAGYLRQGVQCVICSDDPQLFLTKGLSYDFWEAIMAWNLTLADIKKLCLNSITYSSLTDTEKKEMFVIWQKAWDAFVKQILAEVPST